MEQIPHDENNKIKDFFSRVAGLKEKEREEREKKEKKGEKGGSIHFNEVIPEELTEEDKLWHDRILEWENKDSENLLSDEHEKQCEDFKNFINEWRKHNQDVKNKKDISQSRIGFNEYLANRLQGIYPRFHSKKTA